ncbi:MAG: M50 family metallopeptidase [Bacteroidia bacterium]
MTLESILNYLKDVGFATLWQTFILLGPLTILSLIMHFLAQWNENLSYKVLGKNIFLYGFAWLGTAIHELGHALFALLFFHKIDDIKLFDPKGKGGSMGYVSHSYNKKNIYQNVGNLFIGIGPVLLGALLLFLISYFLFGFTTQNTSFDVSPKTFTSINEAYNFLKSAYESSIDYGKVVFLSEKSTWWKIALLVFLLYSIGSSMTLSPSDLKGTWQGFLIFIIVLLVFNISTLWIGNFVEKGFIYLSNFVNVLSLFITLSICVNFSFVILLKLISFFQKS